MAEIRCRMTECQFAPCELTSFNDARFSALEHAWENRGHVVELWQNGSVRATYVVAEIKPWTPASGMDELRLQITATIAEAVRAVKFNDETLRWPPGIVGTPAWVLLQSVPLDPEKHVADWHCLVDEETGCCAICGVGHDGPPCPECGGLAFHRLPCILLAPERAIEPVQGGAR